MCASFSEVPKSANPLQTLFQSNDNKQMTGEFREKKTIPRNYLQSYRG